MEAGAQSSTDSRIIFVSERVCGIALRCMDFYYCFVLAFTCFLARLDVVKALKSYSAGSLKCNRSSERDVMKTFCFSNAVAVPIQTNTLEKRRDKPEFISFFV